MRSTGVGQSALLLLDAIAVLVRKADGFQTELRFGGEDDPIPAVLQLTDTFKNTVDLLVGLRGLEPEAFSRAIDIQLQGASMRVVAREDFIAMKAFAGSPQDMSDARNAMAAARGVLDLALVRRLAKRYGRDASDGLESLLREQ